MSSHLQVWIKRMSKVPGFGTFRCDSDFPTISIEQRMG